MVETIATDQQQNARKIRDEIRDVKTPRIIKKIQEGRFGDTV